MVDRPAKQIATALDMVVSRSLARDDTLRGGHSVCLVLFKWEMGMCTACVQKTSKTSRGYLELLENLPLVTFNLVSKLPRELQTTVSNVGS